MPRRPVFAVSPSGLAMVLTVEALGARLLAATLGGGLLAAASSLGGGGAAAFASSYAAASGAMAVAWLLSSLGEGFTLYVLSGLDCVGSALVYASVGLVLSLISYALFSAGFCVLAGRPPSPRMAETLLYAIGYTLLAVSSTPQAAVVAMMASWLAGASLAAPLLGPVLYAARCVVQRLNATREVEPRGAG